MADAQLDDHLVGCPNCRAFSAGQARLHRATRVAPADPVPDLTASILAAAAADRRPRVHYALALRWVLVVIAALEMGLAAPGLLGRWHAGGELGTYGIATAIGFLSVAHKPSRAAAVLPMLACAGILTVAVSARHIAEGAALLSQEWPHALLVMGVAVLALLWRHEARSGAPGPVHAAEVDAGTGRIRLRRAA